MDIEWTPQWPSGIARMELQADTPESPPDREEIRRQLGWHLLPHNAPHLHEEEAHEYRS
jgi:hypothetical protein